MNITSLHTKLLSTESDKQLFESKPIFYLDIQGLFQTAIYHFDYIIGPLDFDGLVYKLITT